MKTITVLLADDHTIIREGLKALLEAETGIQVVGEAEGGRRAVEMTKTLRPAVVLMDIGMPNLNGFEATRQIRKFVPETKVLILSAYSEDAYVERAFAMGAGGYLVKDAPMQILCRAIREVEKGNTFYSTAIARRLFRKRNQPRSLNREGAFIEGSSRLSSREAEVLQLIAEGKANKEIGDELGISIKTVEKHRQSLMRKLDIRGTAGLTRYATAMGMIEADFQLAST